MFKKTALTLIILAFIVGIGLGAAGHWYYAIKLPEIEIYKEAEMEQERLNEMVHVGTVVTVGKQNLVINATKIGSEELTKGENVTIIANNDTTLQNGMDYVNEPDQELDLTKYLEPGMEATILIEDGKALVIYYTDSHSLN